MSDAQSWTTIGGLFTVMLTFLALMIRMFGHTLDARFAGFDAKSDARFDAVGARLDALTLVMTDGFEQVDKRFEQVDRRFEQVDRRFEQVDRRFDRIETRVDALDRDVHAITRRLMDGPDPAA
jgi:septal ring factor EnvC (AmiA/AmiB activator)